MYCQTEQTDQWDQREQARGSALPESGTLGWNDEIEQDGEEYVLLPEGDYCFTVTGVERARFPGNSKTEPCNKMIVTLEVDSEEGRAAVRESLLLTRKLEWKLCAFFRSIGMKKHGEKVRMDWAGAVGRRGRAHFRPREYDANGEKRMANGLVRFLDWDAAALSEPAEPEDLPW